VVPLLVPLVVPLVVPLDDVLIPEEDIPVDDGPSPVVPSPPAWKQHPPMTNTAENRVGTRRSVVRADRGARFTPPSYSQPASIIAFRPITARNTGSCWKAYAYQGDPASGAADVVPVRGTSSTPQSPEDWQPVALAQVALFSADVLNWSQQQSPGSIRHTLYWHSLPELQSRSLRQAPKTMLL
jgi:hypothetical protein